MVKTLPRHRWRDEEFRTCVPGPLSPDSPVFPPPPEGRTYVGWYGGHRGPNGGGDPQPFIFAIPCPWAAACGPSCGAEARCLLARRQGAEAGETVPVVDLDKRLNVFLERHLKGISDPVQREQERARFFRPDRKMKRITDMADQDLARVMSKLTWGMLYSTYPKTPGPLNVVQTHLIRFHGGGLPPQLAELKPGTTVKQIKPWKPPGAADAEGRAAKRPRKTVTVTTINSEEDDEEEEIEEEEEEEEEDEGQLESSGGEDSSEEEEGSEDEREDEEEQDKVPARNGAHGRAGCAVPVAAQPSGRRQGPLVRPAVVTTAQAAAAAKANGGGGPRPLKRQRNTGPGPAPAVASPAPAARQPGGRAKQGRGPEPGGQAAVDAECKRRKAAESVLEAAQQQAAALEQELEAALQEAAAERRQRRKVAAEAEQSARDLAEQLAAAEAAADEAQAQAAEEAEARDAAEERLAAAQADLEAERGRRRDVEAQLGQERARVRMLTQAARQGGPGGAGEGQG